MEKSNNGNADNPPLTRELLGHVWVDSGQLVLIDPIYSMDLDVDAIEASIGLQKRAELINNGMAAAIRSGIRNARYPVYVWRYENGTIARMEIIFDERLTDATPDE